MFGARLLLLSRGVKITAGDAPGVSLKIINKYLNRNRISYRDGHASFLVKCTRCYLQPGAQRPTVYVNKITGTAICNGCSLNVPWKEFTEMFALQEIADPENSDANAASTKPETDTNEKPRIDTSDVSDVRAKASTPPRPHKRPKKRIREEVANLQQIMDQAKPWGENSVVEEQARKIFELQKLDSSIMRKYMIHTAEMKFPHPSGNKVQQPCLIFPSYDNALASLKVVSVAPPPRQQTMYFELQEDGPIGLFGWDTMPKTAKEVVITGNEFDAIAVDQKTRYPAISLPQGSFSLPLTVLPLLEKFEKIYLWLGCDAPARQAAAKFAKKLDEKRCYIIGSQDEKHLFTSALDALNKNLNISKLISSAKPVQHKHIMSFKKLRDDVIAEIYDDDRLAGVKWKRFPLLTHYMRGHRPGELTVFTGSTGSGKTTLMSEMSLDLCQQGVSTLWGSFEIRNVRLAKIMLKQFSGVNLQAHPNQCDYWANRFQQMPLYFMDFYGEMNIETVLEAMSHAAYVHDIQHVVIDNLQFMVGTGNRILHSLDDSFGAQNHAIAEFRKFASNKNIHVTVVIHPRKENDDKPLSTASIYGTAKATQEADNVYILQSQPQQDKYLQITKNRFAGDHGKVPLKFDKETLTFSDYFTGTDQLTNQHTARSTSSATPSTKVTPLLPEWLNRAE